MARHGDITVEVDFREWEIGLRAMEHRIWRATFRATQAGMYVVERNVKMYLRTFTHSRGTPTPSPRGAPPALVSGHLRRTWHTGHVHEGLRPWTVEVDGGPTAVYSRIQELGGWAGRNHTSHLPKRPYVRPMVKASRREIRRIYIEYWTDAIRG